MRSVATSPRRVLAAIPAREERGGVLARRTARKAMPCPPILPVASKVVLWHAFGERRRIIGVAELAIDIKLEKRRLFIVG